MNVEDKFKTILMKKIFLIILTAIGLNACSTNGEETIDITSYQTQNQQGMEEVYQFIKDCGYYFIATTDGDQPKIRPFGTIHIFENKLYIQTGHKKNVAKQISKNNKIGICAYNGKEWIRVDASLVEDTRVEAKKSMLDAYPNLRSMYNENDDNTAVYVLTNAKAEINITLTEKKTITF